MAWIAVIGMLAIIMVFNNYGMISYDTWRWLHPVTFAVVALLILCTLARCCKWGSNGKRCGSGECCKNEGGESMKKNCRCGGVGPCQCKKSEDIKPVDTK